MTEISQGKPINGLGSRPVRDHSRFNNSYQFANTLRFGEYSPHFAADVVPDDEHTLRCRHVIRSYTLGAPLLQDIKIKKDYFLVPLSAILPLNYEKFITSPNIGEDVDARKVGTSVVGFRNYITDLIAHMRQLARQSSKLSDYLRVALVTNLMMSSGSLLNTLGCHLFSPKDSLGVSIDSEFDNFVSKLLLLLNDSALQISFSSGNSMIVGAQSAIPAGTQAVTMHEAISRMMDDFAFQVSVLGNKDEQTLVSGLSGQSIFAFDLPRDPVGTMPVDLARPIAYQMICAHFFSNDHVDYIYSAELYRQNVYALLKSLPVGFGFVDDTFSWNGVDYRYDVLSAYNFEMALGNLVDYDATSIIAVCQYLRLLFGFNRSLRFVDYFTGSRTRPLAVGDAGVAVNDGFVNVVETMQKRWYIKLWNQIGRVGHRMSEQMKGLFPNVDISSDWHDPIWLAHTDDVVNADETDNTSSEQFSENVPIPITSSLYANADKYAFNLKVNDRYGVVLGITYFDISRFYTQNIERTFFHVDRFDKFNPFLQFVGDQKVYVNELVGSLPVTLPDLRSFGYQGRYMEYKQRVNEAAGGFINESLPPMLFLADVGRGFSDHFVLSPDYIRSYPSELDNFYKSLTGYSLGTYFHFIVVSTNELESNRPMAYNPQID